MTSFVELNPATGIVTVAADGPHAFVELTPSTGVVTGTADPPTQFVELDPLTGIVTAVVTDWSPLWQLGTGQNASAVLDFVNGRYYDGSSSSVALSTLVQNATVDAGGLICNAGNINVIGAFLTAMKNAGGATVVAEISGGNNAAAYGILSMSSGGPDSAFIVNGAVSSMDSFTGAGGQQGPVTTVDFTKTATFSMAYDNAGHIENSTAGKTNTYAHNFATITTAQLGSYNASSLWPGRIRSIAIYTGKLSDQYLKGMSWPGAWNKPFNGCTAVGPFTAVSGYIDAGTTLASYFKSNTPWTMIYGGLSNTSGTLKVLFTNVHNGTNPWYGHEVYVNTTGKLRVSIFSGWAGGAATTNLIQVEGSTVVGDNKWHAIAVTYDGSSLASGVKIYVDGVAETLTVTYDNLTGASDTSIGTFEIGGQFGSYAADYCDFFAMSNTARSASYFTGLASAARTRPAVDANTLVQYDFREGSGTTTADRSGNGYTGTLVNSVPWL